MSLISKIEELDRSVFLVLNGAHTEWLDPVIYFATQRWVWVPLYLFLLFQVYRKYGLKPLFLVVVCVALMILFADQTANLFKNSVQRYRPCNNLELEGMVHIVNGYCSSAFSFFSGHATNSFAIAVFSGMILAPGKKKLFIFLLLWAAFVAYTRVYLGVHYPADIVAGALCGTLYAVLFAGLFKLVGTKMKLI